MLKKPAHPMLARLIVLMAMLLIAFVGLILTDINKTGAFRYWEWSSIVYAVLALWLSWHERRSDNTLNPITLVHELFHWAGLVGAVYLISLFVNLGVASRFEAGLFVLTVMSLAIYLAGIYIEISFCLIGIVLALFAAIAAFFQEYLYAMSIPLLLISGGVLFWHLFHREKSK